MICGINACQRISRTYRALYQHCYYDHAAHFAGRIPGRNVVFPMVPNAVEVIEPPNEQRIDENDNGQNIEPAIVPRHNEIVNIELAIPPEGVIEIVPQHDQQQLDVIEHADLVEPVAADDEGIVGLRTRLAQHITVMRRRYKITQVCNRMLPYVCSISICF